MKNLCALLVLVASMALSSSSHAAIIFFINDHAGFNTATSAYQFFGTEDWEESTLAANSIFTFDDPLAPGVANGPFTSGSLIGPGVTALSNTLDGAAVTTSPFGVGGLVTASAGFLGTPSDQVSPNNPDSFDLLINPSGNFSGAVGLNPLYFNLSATSSTSHPGSVVVSVYDPADALLGAQTLSGVDFSGVSFLGIIATGGDNIGRINLWASTDVTNSTAGADNIAVYGSEPTMAPVPEPSTLSLMLGLGGIALLSKCRRKKSRSLTTSA